MSTLKNSRKPPPAPPKASKKRFRVFHSFNQKMHVGSSLHSVMDGSILTRQKLVKQLPFILYITFLAILYIANSYNAEKTIIEIGKIKHELEELRYEYITTKSNLMFHSKQSEIAGRLSGSGIRESVVPPKKIIAKGKD